jgi:hypothetical protein
VRATQTGDQPVVPTLVFYAIGNWPSNTPTAQPRRPFLPTRQPRYNGEMENDIPRSKATWNETVVQPLRTFAVISAVAFAWLFAVWCAMASR